MNCVWICLDCVLVIFFLGCWFCLRSSGFCLIGILGCRYTYLMILTIFALCCIAFTFEVMAWRLVLRTTASLHPHSESLIGLRKNFSNGYITPKLQRRRMVEAADRAVTHCIYCFLYGMAIRISSYLKPSSKFGAEINRTQR